MSIVLPTCGTATLPAARVPPEHGRRSAHIPALDGIRGVAIVLVLLIHTSLAFRSGTTPLDTIVTRVFTAGWVGVDLFFVLSGFLITGILVDAKGSEGYYRNFYARRILRIAPIYYAFLILYLFLAPRLPFNSFHEYAAGPGKKTSLIFYFYNFWMVYEQDFAGVGLGIFWSLAVEEHFYLFWPFVVLICSRRTSMTLCGVLTALSLASRVHVIASGAPWNAAFYLTPCRLDGLSVGAFVALCLRGQTATRRLRNAASWLGPCAGIALLAIATTQGHFMHWIEPEKKYGLDVPDSRWVLTVGITLLAVYFGTLLVAVVGPDGPRSTQALFRLPVLRSFGNYSYGIYIYHSAIIEFINIFDSKVLGTRLATDNLACKLLYTLSAIALSWGTAFLSYHLFESYFLGLKRHFSASEPRMASLHPRVPVLIVNEAIA